MREIKILKCLYLIIAWFDCWVGLYFNPQKKRLYIMIPFIGLYIQFNNKLKWKDRYKNLSNRLC